MASGSWTPCATRTSDCLSGATLVDGDGDVFAGDEDDDAQHALLEASMAGRAALGTRAGAVPRWKRDRVVRQLPPRCAAAGYFNLHAGVRIGAEDRSTAISTAGSNGRGTTGPTGC